MTSWASPGQCRSRSGSAGRHGRRGGRMSTVLMVGTRKGLWIGRSDDAARTGRSTVRTTTWRRSTPAWSTPGRRRPRLFAGASSSWLGPQVRWSDDLGETWQETPGRRDPLPRGRATPRSSGSGSSCPGAERRRRLRRHRARRGVPVRRRRRDLRARARRSGTTRTGPSGAPASAARRSTRSCRTRPTRLGDRGDLDRRRLPDHRRRRLVGAAQPGHPGRLPARGPAVPRVRPVRAQGHPAPVAGPSGCSCRTTAASTAPTTRAASWTSIADGLPTDFGFPIVVHPHEPGHVYVFPIGGGDGRYPPEAQGAGLALRATPGSTWEALGRRPARRLLRRRDARRHVCRRPRPGRALPRRPQRRGVGLGRRRRDPGGRWSRTCPT